LPGRYPARLRTRSFTGAAIAKIFPNRLRRADKRPKVEVQHDDHVNAWLARNAASKFISTGPAPYVEPTFVKPRHEPVDQSAVALRIMRGMVEADLQGGGLAALGRIRRGHAFAILCMGRIQGRWPIGGADLRKWKVLKRRLSPAHKAELDSDIQEWTVRIRQAARAIIASLSPDDRKLYAAVLIELRNRARRARGPKHRHRRTGWCKCLQPHATVTLGPTAMPKTLETEVCGGSGGANIP
jgi:hypothetical protein